MKLLVTFCIAILVAFTASAQAPQFTVERDSAGFALIQPDGSRTKFDTSFVSQSIREKNAQESELKAEADLIERLLSIRRSMAIVREEKRMLTEILTKAQQCVTSH